MSKISFAGKTVIITGSSSGIGAEAAILFAKLGANLVLTGRNVAQLDEVKSKCVKNGLKPEQVVIVPGEITDDNVRKCLIDAAMKTFKRIDVLVNNAGMMTMMPLANFKVDIYDKTQDVNVRSVILLSLLALPHLKASKGNIVNVSSAASFGPSTNNLTYCISKAALDMVTKGFAFEMAKEGVRVNSVNPGGVPTNLMRDAKMGNLDPNSELGKAVLNFHPLGRLGTVSEIAEAVAFLASENASFITGALLPVDGGVAIHGASF